MHWLRATVVAVGSSRVGFRKGYDPNRQIERRLPRIPVSRISAVCAAWLGAMIEAEGTTLLRRWPDNRRPTALIVLPNTDPEIISVALRIAQTGTVSMIMKSSVLSRLPIIRWRVERWWDTLFLARLLAPYSPKAASLVVQMEQVDG